MERTRTNTFHGVLAILQSGILALGTRRTVALASLLLMAILTSDAAQSHVRWFATRANSTTPPLAIAYVVSNVVFLGLFVFALSVVLSAHFLDVQLERHRQAFVRVSDWFARLASGGTVALLLRIGLAIYFASIALYFEDSPITLTPEMKSSAWWLTTLQLLIAGCLLFEALLIPGCVGVLVLYVYSASVYGVVHVLDYHYFVGICVFLVLATSSQANVKELGLLILRFSVGTSFLWVGIEKWLHPDWTHEVLTYQVPMVLMGLDPHFVCMSAGFVEVCLAFFMLFGGIGSQIAAAVLGIMLSAAVPVVGTVDGIGHLPLLFALALLALTPNPMRPDPDETAIWSSLSFCSIFFTVILGFVGLYFLAHVGAAQGAVVAPGKDIAIAGLWVLSLAALAVHAVHAQVSGATIRTRSAA